MDSVRVVRKLQTQILLDTEGGDVHVEPGVPGVPLEEVVDPLSKIIQDVNKRWGADFGSDQQKTLNSMGEELISNENLQDVISNNPKRNAEIHFETVFDDKIDDQFEEDRKLWEQLTNNRDLRRYIEKKMFHYVFNKVLSLRE
jgi:type I restriction enzyme R subunit